MIVLNGNKMLSQSDLHLELQRKLKFPDYYGANLDALWDCLTSWIDLPVQITWNDYDLVETSLGEYVLNVLKVLDDAEGMSVTIQRGGALI